MIRADLPPAARLKDNAISGPEHKLQIVLEGLGNDDDGAELAARHNLSESELHHWRELALAGATRALAVPSTEPDNQANAPAPSVAAPAAALTSATNQT